MRAAVRLVLMLSPLLPSSRWLVAPLFAQQPAPRIIYIYRDSLKRGIDSAYGAIEDSAARICVHLECPNPYVALESLSGAHEAWWINAFASAADTTRIANAYAANRPLMEALGAVAKRKQPLIGSPIAGYAFHRSELSSGPVWPVAGARFMVVAITRNHRPADGTVWEAADSTLYIFRPTTTRQQAELLAREPGTRILAVRRSWSMPAPEWVAADPEFWHAQSSAH